MFAQTAPANPVTTTYLVNDDGPDFGPCITSPPCEYGCWDICGMDQYEKLRYELVDSYDFIEYIICPSIVPNPIPPCGAADFDPSDNCWHIVVPGSNAGGTGIATVNTDCYFPISATYIMNTITWLDTNGSGELESGGEDPDNLITEGVSTCINYIKEGHNGNFDNFLSIDPPSGPYCIDQPITITIDPFLIDIVRSVYQEWLLPDGFYGWLQYPSCNTVGANPNPTYCEETTITPTMAGTHSFTVWLGFDQGSCKDDLTQSLVFEVTDSYCCTYPETHPLCCSDQVADTYVHFTDGGNPTLPSAPNAVLDYTAPAATLNWQAGSGNHPFGAAAGTLADPIRINGDISIPSGADIAMQNLYIEFGIYGRVVVEPGGKLTLSGCHLNGDPVCQSMWQGIRVLGDGWGGPGTSYGELHTNGNSLVEQAIFGATNMDLPQFDYEDPELIYALAHDNTFVPLYAEAFNTAGGHLNIQQTDFHNCIQAVHASFANPAAKVPTFSHADFYITPGTQWFPFDNIPLGQPLYHAGIVGFYLPSLGSVTDCNFDQLGFGVRATAVEKLHVSGCNFQSHSLAGISTQDVVSSLNHYTNILDNRFDDCTVAIQADGEDFLTINDNVVNEFALAQTAASNVGIFLRGCDFEARNNYINQVPFGIIMQQNDADGSLVAGNTIDHTTIALLARGDNTGVKLECNQLLAYTSGIMIMPDGSVTGDLGVQGNCFLNAPAGNTFLPAAGTTGFDMVFYNNTNDLVYEDVVATTLTKNSIGSTAGVCICADCSWINVGEYCSGLGLANLGDIELLNDEV